MPALLARALRSYVESSRAEQRPVSIAPDARRSMYSRVREDGDDAKRDVTARARRHVVQPPSAIAREQGDSSDVAVLFRRHVEREIARRGVPDRFARGEVQANESTHRLEQEIRFPVKGSCATTDERSKAFL